MKKPLLITLVVLALTAAIVGLIFTPIVWAGITTGGGVALMITSAGFLALAIYLVSQA